MEGDPGAFAGLLATLEIHELVHTSASGRSELLSVRVTFDPPDTGPRSELAVSADGAPLRVEDANPDLPPQPGQPRRYVHAALLRDRDSRDRELTIEVSRGSSRATQRIELPPEIVITAPGTTVSAAEDTLPLAWTPELPPDAKIELHTTYQNAAATVIGVCRAQYLPAERAATRQTFARSWTDFAYAHEPPCVARASIYTASERSLEAPLPFRVRIAQTRGHELTVVR